MSGLGALFAPRGVAVVGASRDGAKLGAVMARALAGYGAGCLLVNSRNPGDGVYASVAEARAATGQPVDLVVLCVPAAATARALEDAAAAGVRAALVCAGGFGEAGEVGHERALAEVARRTGVRVLGPNTSGFFVPARGLVASFVPAAAEVPAGDVAVVAASGGVNHALAFELAAAGVGVSLAVGIGGGLDVRATDVLDHLAGDRDTTAVALHVETVPDGPRLLAAVRALVAVKPVVALVVGQSDVGDFARSHTGALATSWRTTRAALRQAGAVVVDDERELVDAVTALSVVRLTPAPDPGVGVVTAQAGPGLLLVDGLRAGGVRVPDLTDETQGTVGTLLPPLTYQRNPVDTGRPGSGFADVLRAVADDAGVDLLVGYALTEPDSVDLVAATQDAGLPATTPTVLATGGPTAEVEQVRSRLRKLGVPVFGTPTAAANAVRALVADARRVTDPPPAPIRPQWMFQGEVDEAQAKDFLAALGIRVPPGRVCGSRTEARQALAELGAPVAVKLLDATVTHKTDIGGVHLDIRTESDLDTALNQLDATATRLTAPNEVHPANPSERDFRAPGGPPVSSLSVGADGSGGLSGNRGSVHPAGPSERDFRVPGGPPVSSLPVGADGSGGLSGNRGSVHPAGPSERDFRVPGGPPVSSLPVGADGSGGLSGNRGSVHPVSPSERDFRAPGGPPISTLSVEADVLGARCLVEAMVPSGVELVVGARRDPVFGPVVLLGLGGTAAEALADVTIRVAPLALADAARMPAELAGSALLGGWRGAPALDPAELARVLVTLGDALVTMPELHEIEVNPLRVTDDGLIALDCVITKEARDES